MFRVPNSLDSGPPTGVSGIGTRHTRTGFAFNAYLYSLPVDVPQTLGHFVSLELAEAVFTQEALKVFEPEVNGLVVFVDPRAAEQDFFFVFGFLCRSAELIQILVKLTIDAGVLADLHNRTVCFSHFLHELS